MSDDASTPRAIVCPNCGRTESRSDVRICPHCGAMLPGLPLVPSAPPIIGPMAQAQAERPRTLESPHQPWAVLPDNTPNNATPSRDRAKPGAMRGCVTVLLWLIGGFLVLVGLLILGILLFCGGFKP